MAKLLKYITPLFVVFFISLFFAIKSFFTPNEEGWSQILALLLFFVVSLPALILNLFINKIVDQRRGWIILQLIASALFVKAICFFVL